MTDPRASDEVANRLREMLSRRQRPFSRRPEDQAAMDVYGELAAYEADVAGYVSRILAGERFRLRVLGPYRSLERMILELRVRRPDLASVAAEYEREYAAIQRMIALALQLNARRSQQPRKPSP